MTPILYSSDEIDFLNNGLGQLVDLYDVDIHEQRNGLLNLTAYYPVNGQHYADISEGNIILAKPSPLDDNHAFRIVSVALDVTGYAVMIEADSITYDLTNNLSKTIHMLGDGQAAMTAIQNSTLHPHIFTFYSDITHTSESQLRYVNPMEAIAGTQGSFLQIWGGELKRENRRVAMFNRRGRDNVSTFRLGKNIAGLKYTVDVSNLTTEIIPTVTVNSTDASRTIEGATVQSSRMGNYPLVYSKMVDVSQDVKVDQGDTDDQIKAKINAFAADWFVKSANTGKDLPEVTVEVEVESLQDSADYADKFAKLETIGLTDTVTVYVPEYGVNVTAIVNELHYDPIGERVTSLVVGTAKLSFADANKSALSDLENKVTQVQEQATQAVTSANGKNKIYTERTKPDHPQAGDTWFWEDGENSGIKVFKNGDWVDVVDTQTNERIDNAVDSAVSEATSHADSLNAAQTSMASSVSASTAAALSVASAERNSLANMTSSMVAETKATNKSLADSAYAGAMAGVTSAGNLIAGVSAAVIDMGSAVTANKSDIAKVGSDLATGVASAAAYADSLTAKVGNSTSAAVSSIAIDVTGVKAEFDSARKTDRELSVATNSLSVGASGIATKLTEVTSTASGAMSAAASVAANVSGLQASFNVISKNVGGINLLYNTEFENNGESWSVNQGSGKFAVSVGGNDVGGLNLIALTLTGSYVRYGQTVPINVTKGSTYTASAFVHNNTANGVYIIMNEIDSTGAVVKSTPTPSGYFNKSWGEITSTYTVVNSGVKLQFSIQVNGDSGNSAFFMKPQLEQGSVAHGYVIGKQYQDLSALQSASASYSAGIAGISASIDTMKSTESTLTKATNSLAVTASGLTGQMTSVSSTASGAMSTAASIAANVSGINASFNNLSSQHARDVEAMNASYSAGINGLSTDIKTVDTNAKGYATAAQNSAVATASQIATNITNTATTSLSNGIAKTYATQTQLSQTASQFGATATSLQNQVNEMGQVNQLTNTEFNPDAVGWYLQGNGMTGTISSDWYITVASRNGVGGSNGIAFFNSDSETGYKFIRSEKILLAGQNPALSYSLRIARNKIGTNGRIAVEIEYFNSKDQQIDYKGYQVFTDVKDWNTLTVNNITSSVTTDLQYARLAIYVVGANTKVYFGRPIVVFGKSVSGYVPGNYNNNSRVASLELNVDGITGVVNDPSKGLSATWNLANNGQTIAVQASNAAAQAITTASAIQTKVSQLGAINRLLNTEFDPDLQSWVDFGTGFTTTIDRKWLQHGSNNINLYRSNDDNNWRYKTQTIFAEAGVTFSFGVWAKINSMVSSNGLLYIHVRALDDSHSVISDLYKPSSIKATNGFEYFKVEGLVTPTGTKYLEIALGMRYAGNVSFNQPMLSFTNTLGDYVPGNYSNNDLLETYRTQLAGQITDEVANRTSGDNSVRTQLTDLVNQQVTSVTNGYQTAITQASNAIMASVSGINLFTFSRFEDSGNNKWPGARQTDGTITKWGYFDSGNNGISVTSTGAWQGFWHSNIPVSPGQVMSASVMINNNGRNDDAGRLDIWFVDKSGNRVSAGGNTGIGSASGWVMAKVENMTVPSGVAYMQVSLLNRIAAGPTHYALPMVNVGSKALPYTPDVAGQTALQLFADSFALSLKDNTGNIISGINGDPSGMTIAAKKLTVSADTTFLGTNWLNGAVIKDASISNAQIADASITSAKIVNLDVNKISGEVANFIRAYWDGQYGSTSITSEGMTVSAGVTTTVFDENGMQLNKSNRSVGRIGVNDLYQDNSKKGLYFGLEATGDFMAWGAQNYAGNPYDTKLSWYRVGSVPSNLIGTIEGFNFQDNVLFNRPVEMRAGIKVQGTDDRLVTRTTSLNGRNSPSFGTSSAGFAYVSDEVYLISNGTAYNLSKVIKALSGISNAAIPTGFASDGKAVGWYNVNFR